MSEIHEPIEPDELPQPMPKPPSWRNNDSWRDNGIVLSLVRTGFILQFYIPAIICLCIIWYTGDIVWQTGTYVPKVVPKTVQDSPVYERDGVYYGGDGSHNLLNKALCMFSFYTLILLVVQCTIFTLILRFARLRYASIVLGCLIVINIIHSLFWLYFMLPLTLIRLAIPTIQYILAICFESGKNAECRVEKRRVQS